jgi:hypothetical protein
VIVGVGNSAGDSDSRATANDNQGQNRCEGQQINPCASAGGDAAAVGTGVAEADAETAGSRETGACASMHAPPVHDIETTPASSSASSLCSERPADEIQLHVSSRSPFRGGDRGAEAEAHFGELRAAHPNTTPNLLADRFSQPSDELADGVDVVRAHCGAQLPHLRNPFVAVASKDDRSLSVSVGQEAGDRLRGGDHAGAEKSVSAADDFEFYAVRAKTATSSCGTSGAGVSNSGGRVAAETSGQVATLSSPSEDFYSIYSGNGDYTLAAASAPETSSAPPVPPPVYLPNSDAWVEVLGPAGASFPLQSLCVNRRTAWCVDRCDRLCYAVLGEPGIQWIALEQPAQLIACSPAGHIVWRLYRGSAYAAAGRIAKKTPAGSEWREVARDVAYLAVDDNVVWYDELSCHRT